MQGSSWRFRSGATLFIVGFAMPLLIPFVAASGLPTGWKTVLSGLLAVGIPELFSIAGVAVVGRDGFERLKSLFHRLLMHYGPPQRVGLKRYRLGLTLFVLPLLFAWLSPYLGPHVPGYSSHRLAFAVAGDLLLVSSLVILGGEFWDKLRALFHHGASAVFPE